jgi:hypothetical protein
MAPDGLAAGGEHVYAWKCSTLRAWTVDGQDPIAMKPVELPVPGDPVVGILPGPSVNATVITGRGRFYEWNLDSGTLQAAIPRLDNAAYSQARAQATRLTDQQKTDIAELVRLSKTLPKDKLAALEKEARERTKREGPSSPEEAQRWLLKQYRQLAAATQKAASSQPVH